MNNVEKSYFEPNMAVLKKHHYSLWENIKKIEPSPDLDVFYTSLGKPNLRVKKADGTDVYLHDKDNPEAEIPQFLNMIPENANGVVLLTGMGLGYTPRAILKNREKIQYLAVFDFDLHVFSQALKYMDLSSMLSDSRLLLCINPEPEVDKTLETINLALQLEDIHDLKHVPSFRLDREKYEQLSTRVFTIANQYNLGGGGFLKGGKVYASNKFKHLHSMYKNRMLEDIKGKFENFPAILVAGGPSLDKNIHLLPKLKNRAVIIAVDSTLPALVAEGVIPDFMTAIDPYDFIYEKFADTLSEIEDTFLIASAWVAPAVTDAFLPDKILWTFSGRNMENWMQEAMGGTIPSGGASTVAHLNLVAAIIMGCSPIIFMGQDLCYGGKEDHALKTALTQNQDVENLLKSKDLQWVKAIHGDKVPTSRAFTNHIRHFEDLIKNNPGIYINATARGAHIKGTVPMDLEEAVEKYCIDKSNVFDVVSSSGASYKTPEKFLKAFRWAANKNRVLIKEIDKSDVLQKKAAKALGSAKDHKSKYKKFNDLPKQIQKQINGIDKSHKKIDSYGKIWGILDELTMEGLRTSERHKKEIDRLEQDPQKYTQWLLKNFERLNDINRARKKELTYFNDNVLKLITYFEQENNLLKQVGKKNKADCGQVKLAHFYFDNSVFSMLADLCLNLDDSYDDDADINFYKGCTSLIKNEFESAESHFHKAGKINPEIKEKVKKFRADFGNQYVNHAAFFKGKGENTVRRMIIKGLKYCSDHQILLDKLKETADTDLKRIKTACESANFKDIKTFIEKWIDDIENHDLLCDNLESKRCGKFFRFYAFILAKEGNFEKAIANFNKAIFYDDCDPESFLLKADACFAVNDFDNGVESLNRAVTLDRNYAQFWLNMGDNLAESGNFNDALAAYEQYMIAAPENRMVLKKIAQCYLQTGQVEAAREALHQLKQS